MSPFEESEKLVRCEVSNCHDEASVRLVELDSFKLWEYLMVHKHHMQISNPTLCLWVSLGEFEENEATFEHYGALEPVDRILVDLFDGECGYSQTSIRYARSSETKRVIEILKSHVPQQLHTEEACNIQVIPGMIVQQWQHDVREALHIGLSNQDSSVA